MTSQVSIYLDKCQLNTTNTTNQHTMWVPIGCPVLWALTNGINGNFPRLASKMTYPQMKEKKLAKEMLPDEWRIPANQTLPPTTVVQKDMVPVTMSVSHHSSRVPKKRRQIQGTTFPRVFELISNLGRHSLHLHVAMRRE